MYQYFMGEHGNGATKNSNVPVVIETEKAVSRMIQKWLDKYQIDLDEWVDAVCQLSHSEIRKIVIEDTQIFNLILANGNSAFIELFYDTSPKCRLLIGEEEYSYYLQNGLCMEKCLQVKNEIQFGANASENRIMIGKKPVFITIELEKFDERLYHCVKRNIDSLESWDIIANVMEWLHSLPVEIYTYQLTIISISEKLIGMQKVFVEDRQANCYIHVNPTGQFQVSTDGTWSAEFNGIRYRYNLHEKKVTIQLPRRVRINVVEYYKYFSYVIELIGIMFGTLQRINEGFTKIEEGRS